jgi:FAD/FMN-containing dehydrogenase
LLWAIEDRVHSVQVPGAANIDDGILFALSAFKDITVSPDNKTVEAGPGLTWYELYSALEPYGLVVVGGRLKTIGIAGLTIGGGISYFTSKYGFAMDNVVAYEVVLADGSVVNATATSQPDLFWALKGGGNNFGIVTKFTFATIEMPSIGTAIVQYPEDSIPAYCEAVANYANSEDAAAITAGGIFTIRYIASTDTYSPVFLGVKAGGSEDFTVFNNFTSVPNLYTLYNITTLLQWTTVVDPLEKPDR